MNRLHRQGRFRRGVSLLEVLFAIMITAIGLMGAIAVFPAALLQIKRGQQADMTAAAGLSGHHAFRAAGMGRPDRWLYWETNPPGSLPAQYWPVTQPYNDPPYTTMNPPLWRFKPDGRLGFCIDPRFIAANSNDVTAHVFPYNASNPPYGSNTSRMARVTLNIAPSAATSPMSALQAELNFRIDDDLSIHRFTGRLNGIDVDRTNHTESHFERSSAGTALKRESDGHMSWMATVVPKIERYGGGAVEDQYILSIIVFYDRPNQLLATVAGGFLPSEWELTVDSTAANYGGGTGGGEMRLISTTTLGAAEQTRQVTLHRDQWIMLTNIPPSGSLPSGQRHVPICRWYRIVDSDDPLTDRVDVSLAGADWEVPANETRAVVVQGAIAVYEKTIKLEAPN